MAALKWRDFIGVGRLQMSARGDFVFTCAVNEEVAALMEDIEQHVRCIGRAMHGDEERALILRERRSMIFNSGAVRPADSDKQVGVSGRAVQTSVEVAGAARVLVRIRCVSSVSGGLRHRCGHHAIIARKLGTIKLQ